MNRKIVITGASSLIGLAIFRKLAVRGDSVVLQCRRNRSRIDEVDKPTCREFSVIEADLANDAALNEFCKMTDGADVLINAAAVTVPEVLPMTGDNDIGRMIAVNITALVKICRATIPYMASRRKGCIINLSSIAASRGNRGLSVYSGTKGFVESFSRALAAEYGKRGVRVNCIAPGPIEAGNLKNLLSYAPDEIMPNLASNRLGTPEDIANLVSFLVSPDAEFITGQVIKVDGGFMKGL